MNPRDDSQAGEEEPGAVERSGREGHASRAPHLADTEAVARAVQESLLGYSGGTAQDCEVIAEMAEAGYCLLDVAGRGATATVWRAERYSDGATVAVKVPHNHLAEALMWWGREARVLSHLRHHGIVSLLDSGQTREGRPYLIMEWVEGRMLAHLLKQTGLPWQKAWPLFRQILIAVAAAHATGVAHGDLKPSNILVMGDGTVKVTDFGLAQPVEGRQIRLSILPSGMVAGTEIYMAPECFRPLPVEAGEEGSAGAIARRRPERATPRADVYSLGTIFCQMLSGTLPRGLSKSVADLKRVDVRVDALLARATAEEPERRPSASEMVAELDAVDRSPARYSGAALMTREVQLLDGLWTCLGLLSLWIGGTTVMEAAAPDMGLPWVPFRHAALTREIAALLGAASVTGIQGLMMIWQLLRLRRFRGAPWAEALPQLFGMKLRPSRFSTGTTVASHVILGLTAMGVAGGLFADARWLDPAQPGYQRGLAVMDGRETTDLNPWSLHLPSLFTGSRCWLVSQSRIDGKKHTSLGRIGFVPLVAPLLFCSVAGFMALGSGLTLRRMWKESGGRRMVLWGSGVFLVFGGVGLWGFRLHAAAASAEMAQWESSDRSRRGTSGEESRLIKAWLEKVTQAEQHCDGEGMAAFCAPQIAWREMGTLSATEAGKLLSSMAPPPGVTDYFPSGASVVRREGHDLRADTRYERHRTFADGSAEASILEFFYWLEPFGESWRIIRSSSIEHPIYRAESSSLTVPEATALLDGWLADWAAGHSAPVVDLFAFRRLPANGYYPPELGEVEFLRAFWQSGLSAPYSVTRTSPVTVSRAPGARHVCSFRILLNQKGTETRFDMVLDLVRIGSRWRCVRAVY